MARVHTHVDFQFAGDAPKTIYLTGAVSVSRGGMTLEISDAGRIYVLRGTKSGAFFQASQRRSSRKPLVRAKWRQVKRGWVGEWVEEGLSYVFAFQLKPVVGDDPIYLDPKDELCGLNPAEVDALPGKPPKVPAAVQREIDKNLDGYIRGWSESVMRLLAHQDKVTGISAKPRSTLRIARAHDRKKLAPKSVKRQR